MVAEIQNAAITSTCPPADCVTAIGMVVANSAAKTWPRCPAPRSRARSRCCPRASDERGPLEHVGEPVAPAQKLNVQDREGGTRIHPELAVDVGRIVLDARVLNPVGNAGKVIHHRVPAHGRREQRHQPGGREDGQDGSECGSDPWAWRDRAI